MERNWYIICTKSKQEKKVITSLTKKGIECFCPFADIEMKHGVTNAIAWQPLFPAYVFANISLDQMAGLKRIPAIISIAHWMDVPVIVSKEEIDAIKMVTENYVNIQLEKSVVKIGANMSYVVNSITTYNNNVASVNPQALKIVLPTLGYNLVVERAERRFDVIAPGKKFSFGSIFSRKPQLSYATRA